LATESNWKRVEPPALAGALSASVGGGVVVRRDKSCQGPLYHLRRRLKDGELLFLVNTSCESPCSGTIATQAGGVERWDPDSGRTEAYFFAPTTTHDGSEAEFELPPGGSLLLFLSQQPLPFVPKVAENVVTIAPSGPPEIQRVGPNVLTLDYVDVTAGGETKEDVYFYQAGQFVWQKRGLECNPWDSSVQFRDELIRKTFPAESGFEATYRFAVEGGVPADLAIVIERPDLYTITCNGQPVTATPGAWWLDEQFGRIDIARAAKVGANEVTIKACPMTMYHELESAYVLGDFALRTAEKGFVIVPPVPLELGQWNEQGHPFLATGVTYAEKFDLSAADGTGSGRYVVALPAWYGAVAKVVVNGQVAGYIGSQPYECDVTPLVTPGENTIEVTVIGTLKNTLGPHHGNPPLGTAWPAMFQKAPNPGPPAGGEYATVGYGLFEPFVVRRLGR
jgi:hypothetical protein